MKAAISNKGVEPTGGLTTYADAIRNIPYSIEYFDFSPIGYDSADNEKSNVCITTQIEYSKSLYDKYNGVLSGDINSLFAFDFFLKYCPKFDTSNVTDMTDVFLCNYNLLMVPELDTSNVTNMAGLFLMCESLKYLPELDTSNVTNMMSMFEECSTLESIPLLDARGLSDASTMFRHCLALTDMGGLKNLGMNSSLDTDGMFTDCDNLTHDSIMNIINNLYDRAAVGYSLVNLPLGEYNLNKISDAEKQIAINKGWILS